MPTVFRFLAESNRYAIISYGSSHDLYLIVITWEKFKEVYAVVDSETAVWETLSFRQCHSARLKMKAYVLESVQLHPPHASFSVICQSFARVRNINARLQQSYPTANSFLSRRGEGERRRVNQFWQRRRLWTTKRQQALSFLLPTANVRAENAERQKNRAASAGV